MSYIQNNSWEGKPAIRVKERILIKLFVILWAIGFILVIISHFLFSLNSIIGIILLLSGPLSSLVFLILGGISLMKLKDIKYKITSDMITKIVKKTPHYLKINEISEISVVKTRFELIGVSTGSIIFYDQNNKKCNVKLSFIENVDDVASFIKKFIQ